MSNRQPQSLSSTKRILNESPAAGWWFWYLAAWFIALSVAGLILVVGTIAKLLEDGGLESTTVSFGKNLSFPVPDLLLDLEPLGQLVWLVGFGFGLAVLQAVALWWFYRGIFARAREISHKLHEQVLATSLKIAATEGISAQRNRTSLLIDQQLPKVRSGLISRWRAIPRSVVLAVICTVLALLVDVWLTLLAMISGMIVWRLYLWLRQFGQGQSGVSEVKLLRKQMIETVQEAPLISRIRGDEMPVVESGSPLTRLVDATISQDAERSRALPTVNAATACVVALMLLAIGGNMLLDPASMTLPAALVLTLSLLGAVTGAMRVLRYWNEAAELRDACDSINHYVDRAANGTSSERMGLGGAKHAIELDDVRLVDSVGRTLLDGISLRLEPASMVAFMGTDPLSVNSLAELLLGFGNPKAGRLTIGDVPISQLHEKWLAKNVMWVGRKGPLWSGTITENLSFANGSIDTSTLSAAMRKSGVYDRIQELPDGFSSLISSDDERLDEATRYGLAIARAWIRKPAILVVEEPPLAAGTLTDDPALETLREMADDGSVVIILPQRLRSLRTADRVILMNGGRLAGEGKHEELLATSDLYRHLNYVLFNPFRHMAPGGRHSAMA